MYPMAYITRLTKTSMLDALNQDYIRTARAKGVPSYKVIFKHALRNALIPVVTYVGPMIAFIITGSMVVETIFSTGGLGQEFCFRYYEPRLHDDHGHDDFPRRPDGRRQPDHRYCLQGH